MREFRYSGSWKAWLSACVTAFLLGLLGLIWRMLRLGGSHAWSLRPGAVWAIGVFTVAAVVALAWVTWLRYRWARRAWVRMDDEGITACGPDGREERLAWAEIEEVRFRDASFTVTLGVRWSAFGACTLRGGDKSIRISGHLDRSGLFREILWDTERFESRTGNSEERVWAAKRA